MDTSMTRGGLQLGKDKWLVGCGIEGVGGELLQVCCLGFDLPNWRC